MSRQRESSLLSQPSRECLGSPLKSPDAVLIRDREFQAAFNAIENYEDAEIDCSRALLLNKSHLKAWYRRAIARKGLGRFDEAEQGKLGL